MFKKFIKSLIAKATEKMIRFSVYRGCLQQDDIIDKFSHYEHINADFGELVFFCPGTIPTWRAKTFFSKEPETLSWIRSFDPKDSFLDVGANVGLYSIYASKRGHKVWAIEPLIENCFILQKNIYINNVNNAEAFCACLYDQNKIDCLKIRNIGFGQAQNSFHENLGAYDEIYEYSHQQGVVGLTLDYFVEQFGVPNHIKIDVDGHELKVLNGGKATLLNPKLKSILIEINETSSKCKEICSTILNSGFSITDKSSSEMMNNDKYRMFKNYVFTRESS